MKKNQRARAKRWGARALTIGWYCSIAVSSAAASCVSLSLSSTGADADIARLCLPHIHHALGTHHNPISPHR